MFFYKEPLLADIHCHLVPYVDDGASDVEDAKNLIKEEYVQGVRLMAITPHLRYGMFDTPIDTVRKHFDELSDWTKKNGMDHLRLYLSREYYCDERFITLMEGYAKGRDVIEYDGKKYTPSEEIISIGNSKAILLEFSSGIQDVKTVTEYIELVRNAGLVSIIAHAERYAFVQRDPLSLGNLRKKGAYVQINANAILGKGDRKNCITAKSIVREDMADIVSSDAHDMASRKPRLKKCYNYLRISEGKDKADQLMYKNAEYLMHDNL